MKTFEEIFAGIAVLAFIYWMISVGGIY